MSHHVKVAKTNDRAKAAVRERSIRAAFDISGLCQLGRRCVRKDAHDGRCWPQDGPGSTEPAR